MTISSNNRKAGPYVGNGTASVFPFAFKIFQASDLEVVRLTVATNVETLFDLTTDYTVTLNADQDSNPGGSITLVAGALATGYNLVITSDIENLQPTDLTNQGGFYPDVINDALDRATIQIQQLQEQTDRAIKVPITNPTSIAELTADLIRLADSADNIDTVANNIVDVNTTADNIADVNTVAGSIANVNTVAIDIAAVTTVANDLNEPVSEIETVANSIANVNTVGNNITNVNTTAANIANVNAVGSDLLEPVSEINTVAVNITNVNTVGTNIADVNTVATNIADVGIVADNIADVVIAADNVADITNFADVYQGGKAADPALRNNGSALQIGDMYFNTTVNELRVYSGTSWIAGTAGTLAVQRFSGTGSETAFILATAPSGENNTQVYINGVYQQKDTYGVTGTTLTFSAAPPAGTDNIEVVTISTLALGETTASLVSITDSGNYYTSGNVEGALQEAAQSTTTKFTYPRTGAVERTVASKLADVISVKDFGAVGDGVHDDTAAIQAAINAASAVTPFAVVYFPPNLSSQVYKTTAPLVCNKPVTLRGSGILGTNIMAFGLTAGQYVLDCDNTISTAYHYSIENMSFWSDNGLPSGIHLKNCSYTNIKSVLLRNLVDGLYIEGTVCFSNFFDNVIGYACTGRTVRITNFTGGGQYKFDKCTFTGTTGFSMHTDSYIDGLCFTNCNFEQCVTNSLYIGGSVNGLSFFGCRTEGCDGATDFQINPATGRFVGGLTITGCSFETDAGACIPIYLGGAGGYVRGFSITGNHGGYAGNPYFVYLNGEGESGIIAGNSTIYSTSIVNAKRPGVVVFGNEYTNAGGGKNAEAWGMATWAVQQGSWTPIDASGAGLTLNYVEGIYQRLGNMIYFQGTVNYPSTANTSTAIIGGLPATIYEGLTQVGRAGASISLTDSTATGMMLMTSTTTIRVQNGGFTSATNANMSGKTLYFFGMYRIA